MGEVVTGLYRSGCVCVTACIALVVIEPSACKESCFDAGGMASFTVRGQDDPAMNMSANGVKRAQ